MFTVTVRDHIMVTRGDEVLGTGQHTPGATFLVDAVFRRAELDTDNKVIDVALASQRLSEVLGDLNDPNLDDAPEFAGATLTTEYLAKVVADRLATLARSGSLGTEARDLTGLAVTLHRSHITWASYERTL